jgi:hypothetical protein
LHREARQRFGQLGSVGSLVLSCRRQLSERLGVACELDLPPPTRTVETGEANVVRDLEEPGQLDSRHDTASQPAERVQERRLHRVFGLIALAEPGQAESEDTPRIALV